MVDMYPTKWTPKMGDIGGHLFEVWSSTLKRFDTSTIRKAITFTLESGKDWPPELPEFIAYCKSARGSQSRHRMKALPAPSTHETALKHLAAMKKAVI